MVVSKTQKEREIETSFKEIVLPSPPPPPQKKKTQITFYRQDQLPLTNWE